MTAGYVEEFVEGLGVTAAAGGDQDALRGGQKFATIRAPTGNQARRGGHRGEGCFCSVVDHVVCPLLSRIDQNGADVPATTRTDMNVSHVTVDT